MGEGNEKAGGKKSSAKFPRAEKPATNDVYRFFVKLGYMGAADTCPMWKVDWRYNVDMHIYEYKRNLKIVIEKQRSRLTDRQWEYEERINILDERINEERVKKKNAKRDCISLHKDAYIINLQNAFVEGRKKKEENGKG